jgi:hypothetical protein
VDLLVLLNRRLFLRNYECPMLVINVRLVSQPAGLKLLILRFRKSIQMGSSSVRVL